LCFNNHDIVETVAVPEWDAGGLESVSQTFAPPLDVDGKKIHPGGFLLDM